MFDQYWGQMDHLEIICVFMYAKATLNQCLHLQIYFLFFQFSIANFLKERYSDFITKVSINLNNYVMLADKCGLS